MKPADIWITRRLPTRVSPSKPAFSLERERVMSVYIYDTTHFSYCFFPLGVLMERGSYTETDDPVPVPKIPEKRMPTPCQPMPRLRTECGTGVALAYLETAMKAPVDCQNRFREGKYFSIRMCKKIVAKTKNCWTSTRATNEVAIMANDSPALKVGAPH